MAISIRITTVQLWWPKSSLTERRSSTAGPIAACPFYISVIGASAADICRDPAIVKRTLSPLIGGTDDG